MYYDLSNPLQVATLKMKIDKDVKRGAMVEYRPKQTNRTMPQNRYIHVAISYLALQVGESAEYCKRRYFKLAANGDIFLTEHTDKISGERVKILRSTSDLTKEEMSVAIERFLRWSAEVAEIYIPSAEDYVQVRLMEAEVENRRYGIP